MRKMNLLEAAPAAKKPTSPRESLSAHERLEKRVESTQATVASGLGYFLETKGEAAQVVAEYAEMTHKTPYQERLEKGDLVRAFADRARFTGQPIPEDIQTVWKTKYDKPAFAKVTQDLLGMAVDPNDSGQFAHWFKSRMFDAHHLASFVPAAEAEKVIRLMTPMMDVLDGVTALCRKVCPPQDTNVFRFVMTQIQQETKGQRLVDIVGKNYQLQMYAGTVFHNLYTRQDFDQLTALTQEGILPVKGVMDVEIADFPQDFLLRLATHTSSPDDAKKILKYVDDPDLLTRAMDVSIYVGVPNEATQLTDLARRLLAARTATPQVQPLSPLTIPKGPTDFIENKFILTLGARDERWTVAWGNTKTHTLHKNQLAALAGSFSEALTCGGMIKLKEVGDEELQVLFCERSGDFGAYPHVLLEHLQDTLREKLEQSFPGKKITITFKPSSKL